MASAKQIKARKAFVRKYAKKGKRKAKSKKPKTSKREPTTLQKIQGYQQREPTRKEFKRAGYTESEIDDYFNRQWDKKMQEFLNKSNNES
jgi:hypothetical protein